MSGSHLSHEQSEAAFERAQRVLVGGVNSPVRAFGSVGGNPVFLESAQGAHVTDVDGNRYVDLVGSWGPMIAGHAHPAVIDAVRRTAEKSLSFGACSRLEYELAEVIADALPSVEVVRFVNSGTEATMSTMRLVRAVTGRSRVVKFFGCYHGHVDGLLVAAGSGATTLGTPDSAGVSKEVASMTLLAPYNDLDAMGRLLDEHGAEVAAIMVEPIAGNMGFIRPDDGFLAGLRDLCDRHGCLLVFDEVMTGFRVAWGGYQVTASVRPDITCLGKTIGGGMPVAAYGASRDIMKHVSPLGPMYQAGTLSGNPVGMASGRATLELCRADGFYERLHERSDQLAKGLEQAASAVGVPVTTDHEGGMLGFFFSADPVRDYDGAKAADHARFGRFFHAMLERGVWLPPSGYEAMFISSAHTEEDIQTVIDAAGEALREIA